jgi:crotonobetainyl-CoA:carnitine CoA-transferase CaiB-like acyl-CoA transferase
MGATCVKLEPPAGDPMGHYNKGAYGQLHEGVKVHVADLKTEAGQKILHRELAKANVLLTSFRPSALEKLGMGWSKLHRLYPALSQVAIIGAPGPRAEEPGHDLTYLADNGLVPGLEMPATLYADMSGSLMASEAVLQSALQKRGVFIEVALSEAAAYLALPWQWGLTRPQRLGGRRARGLQNLSVQGRPGRSRGARAPLCRRPCARQRGWPPRMCARCMHLRRIRASPRSCSSRRAWNWTGWPWKKDIPLHTMA